MRRRYHDSRPDDSDPMNERMDEFGEAMPGTVDSDSPAYSRGEYDDRPNARPSWLIPAILGLALLLGLIWAANSSGSGGSNNSNSTGQGTSTGQY